MKKPKRSSFSSSFSFFPLFFKEEFRTGGILDAVRTEEVSVIDSCKFLHKKVLAISFSLIEAHICKYTYCHYFEQLICRGLL